MEVCRTIYEGKHDGSGLYLLSLCNTSSIGDECSCLIYIGTIFKIDLGVSDLNYQLDL